MSDRAEFPSNALPGQGPRPGLLSLWKTFEELETRELYALLQLRSAVFVVEQNCPFADIDGKDGSALHLMVLAADGGDMAGCLRVFAPAPGRVARIGRVATAAAFRGTGLGRWMMREAFSEIDRRFGTGPIELSAQVQVEPFYAALGFERVSADYLEDAIAHCDMRRPG